MNAGRIQLCSVGRRAALTLLEMMVAVTLLAVIMVGLLAMFNQTQKALHIVNAQSDVFENARGAISMLSRDVSEMTAFGDTNIVNFTFGQAVAGGGVDMTLPSGIPVSTRFYEAFWLSRVNDDWSAIGYFVENPFKSVGTLYRFSVQGRQDQVAGWYNSFVTNGPSGPDVHRVSDGIVNFQMNAVYPVTNTTSTNFVSTNVLQLTADDLPAYVDLELGVLEPATVKQMQSLLSDPAIDSRVVEDFLKAQVGRIHFFRQRVPIRNFVNPYRSNEVP